MTTYKHNSICILVIQCSENPPTLLDHPVDTLGLFVGGYSVKQSVALIQDAKESIACMVLDFVIVGHLILFVGVEYLRQHSQQ